MSVDKMKGKNTLGTEATVKNWADIVVLYSDCFHVFFLDIRRLNINISVSIPSSVLVILNDHRNV